MCPEKKELLQIKIFRILKILMNQVLKILKKYRKKKRVNFNRVQKDYIELHFLIKIWNFKNLQKDKFWILKNNIQIYIIY